jgi:multiple sugar transport system ATP-binding protein
MDEPLSNLDAKMRVQTRTDIAKLQADLGVTTVYVTHDQIEAMTMGDRVAVLKDGVLQQVDKPRSMYDRPNNVFVAGFIGSPAMNLITLPVDNGEVRFSDWRMSIPRSAADALTSKDVTFGVRPEDLALVANGKGIPATVELVEELGSDAFLHGSIQGAEGDADHPTLIVARVNPTSPPEKGATVHLAPSPDNLHFFDTATGERLPD